MMNESLNVLMNESPFIGDVRGYGTMLGVEIVEDQDSKKPGKEIALKSLTNQAGATAEQNLNIKKRANKILGFG